MNAGAWARTHKTAAWVGGIAAAGGLALYMRHRSSSSSSSAGTGLSGLFGTSAAPSPGLTGSYGLDTTGIDTYNQLSSAISSQNDAISALQAELASGAAATVPPATGSGVNPPPSAINSADYYQLGLPAEQNLLSSGGTLYQSGSQAIAWDQAHGVNSSGINPTGFYPLAPAAAAAGVAAGNQYYQSGTEALAWSAAHPNG